ncbi:MAG: FG-GAP-like repeat-containing protein, partial [Thermoplasmata archaeon]
MPVNWKRKGVLTAIMAFVVLLSVIVPVLGDSSVFRYDEKRTGNSGLVSDITDPEPRWTFDTIADTGSVPMAGDINGDGKMEIVWGSSDGTLYALDENGQEVWTFQGIGPLYAPPGIADIDGDGMMEVVIGGYLQGTGDPNLYAVNGEDGSLLWIFSTADNGASWEEGFEASPSFYDVNSDDILDVLIGTRDRNFYALNGPDGSILWESQFEHFIRASSPIGDIDHDGNDEILVVDNHAKVRLFEMDGSIDWEIYATYSIVATPIFADLTGDGYDEIIMFSVGWAAMGILGVAMVYDYQGNLLWSNQDHTFFYSSPTLYDVDGDGLLDILNVDSNDQVLIAYRGFDGKILYTAEPFVKNFMSPGLSTADIDGDGEIEVLVGGNPNLYSINAADGSVEWVYDTDGERVGGPLVA